MEHLEHRPPVDDSRTDLADLRGRRAGRDDYTAPAEMTEAQRLVAAGRMLWSATLIGNPPPSTRRLIERMRNPQPGDLVWESSTALRALRDPAWADRVLGWFVKRGLSPWVSREEWESADCEWRERDGQPYEECPTRQIWIIRPWGNPTGEFSWENAELLALPLDWTADEMYRDR